MARRLTLRSLLVGVVVLAAIAAAIPGVAWLDDVVRARDIAAVDLPVVGEAGDLLDTAVRITFAADGGPEINGDPITWAEIDGRLDEIVDAARPESSSLLRLRRRVGLAPPLRRTSGALCGADVIFVLDRRTRWADVDRMIQRLACAAIWRISFAVRTEPGGEPGSFAVFLPRDCGGDLPAGPVASFVGVRIRRDSGDLDPTVVARAAANLRSWGAELVIVDVAPDPDAPIEAVLACAEAARRGGADAFEFIYRRPTAAVEYPGPWRFDVGTTPVDEGARIAPSRGRICGGLGGWPFPRDQHGPEVVVPEEFVPRVRVPELPAHDANGK